MKQGRRWGLSASQRTEIWRRWKLGESLHEIGRALAKDHGSIQCLLAQRGGIAPTARRRSERTLTLAEREDISRSIAAGSSIREIARGLQRAASTVSREVVRHGGRSLYRASEADHRAWNAALRPKTCLLATEVKLRTLVAYKLTLNWAPQQISGWLKTEAVSTGRCNTGVQCICRSLESQGHARALIQLQGNFVEVGLRVFG